MAFIRNYQFASRAGGGRYWGGDPLFGLKIKLPKIKPLKLLGKVAGPAVTAASFLPTPVGVVARVGKLAKVLGAAKTLGKMAAGGAAIGGGAAIAEQAMKGGFAGPMLPGGFDFGKALGGGATVGIDPATGMPRIGRKRYRRMNVTNMKALTRATRRVHRFAKLARTCIRQAKSTKCPRKGARGRKC